MNWLHGLISKSICIHQDEIAEVIEVQSEKEADNLIKEMSAKKAAVEAFGAAKAAALKAAELASNFAANDTISGSTGNEWFTVW